MKLTTNEHQEALIINSEIDNSCLHNQLAGFDEQTLTLFGGPWGTFDPKIHEWGWDEG